MGRIDENGFEDHGMEPIGREDLPLPHNPTFADLVFYPHRDGKSGHVHALHRIEGKPISVTNGGVDYEPEAPWEIMMPDGEVHEGLTKDGITARLRSIT